MRITQITLCVASAACAMTGAFAQTDYPARPVRIIVGFTPGSSNDILARLISAKLTERWAQQVVVDNRPGANAIIGSELAVRATPDGHTLLLLTTSNTMSPALYKLSFDTVKAFTPVAMLGSGPLALVAHPSVPATGVKDFVDLAIAKPGLLSYATAGAGGVNHFAAELFAHSTGIRLLHVPYKGGAPALTDVIAGQVNVMFASMPLALRQVRAGKLKAFGMTSARRTPYLPEVPTIAESGVPGYEISIWWGIAAPSGTPAPVVAKLAEAIGAVVAQPEFVQRLESEGAEPRPLSVAAFGNLVAAEVEKWSRVARAAGIKLQ